MHKARIKLTGTDPEKLAYVCDQLKRIAERTGVDYPDPYHYPPRNYGTNPQITRWRGKAT
jgi:small subunit ribosomal protein S10